MSFTSVSLNINGYNGFTFSPTTVRTREQELLYQRMKSDLNALADDFCLKFRNHFQLIQEAMDVVKIAQEIVFFCHEHDPLKEGPYNNGYRMIAKRFIKFLKHVNRIKVINDKLVSKLHIIMKSLKKNVDILDAVREAEKKHGPSTFNEDIIDITVETWSSLMNENQDLDQLVLDPLVQSFGNGYFGNVLFFFSYFFIGYAYATSWFLAIISLLHKKTRMSIVKDFYLNKNLKSMLNLLDYARSFATTKLTPFIAYGSWLRPWRPFPFLYKKVQVPAQNEWTIEVDVEKRDISLVRKEATVVNSKSNSDHQNTSENKTVNCFVMRQDFKEDQKNPSENVFKNKVLIFCHGGGYVACCSETANCFLPSFVNKMPGLTIVSIDTSLSPGVKFPVPVQECLDVVLWLQSGHESVKEALGFFPESFVFSGDSGGAHMMMTAAFVVNDINRLKSQEGDKTKRLILPERVVTFFPTFVSTPIARASTVTSPLDISLHGVALLSMACCYLPTLPGRKLHPELNCEYGWHLLSKEDMKQSYMDYAFVFSHPYFNLCEYKHFEDFSSVELNVFYGDEDPLFDLGGVFIPFWKGKVTLDIAKGCRHAFIYLMVVSRLLLRGRVQREITRIEDVFVAKMYANHENKRDQNQNLQQGIAV